MIYKHSLGPTIVILHNKTLCRYHSATLRNTEPINNNRLESFLLQTKKMNTFLNITHNVGKDNEFFIHYPIKSWTMESRFSHYRL
jgi:hypothetical protein